MLVYHVTVTDENERPALVRRFVFDNEPDAWTCYQSAIRNGFKATGETVERLREIHPHPDDWVFSHPETFGAGF
jgi:hypothetical protein